MDSFKDFKFNLYDVVRHRSNEPGYGGQLVIVERTLSEMDSGISKAYTVRSMHSEGVLAGKVLEGEIELAGK